MQGARVTHLVIGERDTRVTAAMEDGGVLDVRLPIGAFYPGVPFRRHPPTELELESAIAAVEDVVMPLARALPPDTQLVTADAFARMLSAWLQAGDEVPLEGVERAFNDLADVALGRPAGSSGLPQDAAFDGWLLVLREFMHHCGFGRLALAAA